MESTIKAAEIVHAGKNIRAALAEEGVELKRVHFLIRQVIRQRLDKGRIAAAAELAEQLGDPEDRAGAFLEIAKAQVEAGEKDAARKSLAKALADAERIAAYRAKQDAAAGPEGPDTRYRSRLDSVMSRTYWAAVSIRAKLRDLDAARKLILKAANSKLKPADWDRALDEPEVRTGWSSALVEAGREAEALKLAKGADGKWRPKMRVLVAWLLASRGQTKQIEQLIADVTQSYETFIFHKVFAHIYNFCTVEMSSIYMDVLKDRLYCDAADSQSRRSAQTAMHKILDTLIKLLAPVLVHTAEEAWAAMKHKSQDVESVHFALIPETNPDDRSRALSNEDGWKAMMDLRTHALGKLEDLRKDQIIGSNQEASVKIVTDNEDWLSIDTDMFASLCIVSEVRIEKGDSFEISADKCKHNKCDRCWNYWPSVGTIESHPDLCQRCADVISS